MKYSHHYSFSRPKVCVAKAKNICRVCRRTINKGEKYLFCWFLDRCKHLVTQGGHRSYYPFHEVMKYCKECSVELLRLDGQGMLLSKYHKKNVLEAFQDLLVPEGRFGLMVGSTIVSEYLKEHGINEQT